MGSLVLGYSAYVQTKQKFEDSSIFLLTFHKNKEIIDLMGITDSRNIFTIEDSNLWTVLRDSVSVLIHMRKNHIDTVIDMELFSRFSTLISYLSGAANRVGFFQYTSEGLYRGRLLTHEVLYNPHQHMSLNILSLVYSLNVTEGSPLYKGSLKDKVLPPATLGLATTNNTATATTIIRRAAPEFPQKSRYIVINADPGLMLPIRGWPPAYFALLVKKLLKGDRDLYVVLVGLPSATRLNQEIAGEYVDPRCINLTGQTTSLRELLTVIAAASVLVTNDSGPAHFATLVDTPQVVFFGPETPSLYGPLGGKTRALFAKYSCSPCLSAFNHRGVFCDDNKCLQAISVETAYLAVMNMSQDSQPNASG